MPLAPELEEAYREAIYQVDAPFFQLRIGKRNEAWEAWLSDLQMKQWVVITAFNPGSQTLPEEENLRRHEKLRAQLNAQGIPFLPGRNLDPGGEWPPELSCILLDTPLDIAQTLARQYGQLAMVVDYHLSVLG